ncbi:uncharacterized protein CTRU02_202908 [Colletotrichum truncatum]|uniref:Uncharacterized protein n=1 Tax=Colletotrichum truncatum TaxID=5467 RepID=A0ACC3ZLN3_COLTU|nr:uncharacterized protein CTRU02_13003 [Colletotrichum truncatum]KAF6783987.1 hypothetical protein CTRU02_13003 [Colletotrichum truncatum]
MTTKHEIDVEGDLILTLSRISFDEAEDGDETLQNDELKVSSKVLQLNSPVFKAMLGGKFKEGTELAEKSASSAPYELELPDDDVDAMSILCQILHNVYVPESPRPLSLEKLAYICDKYECINALKYCGIVWIRDWLSQFDDEVPHMSDFCHLLIFAYVIDLPVEFSEISWRIFLYHEGPFSTASDQVKMLVDHPLLRHDIISRFRSLENEVDDTYLSSSGCLETKRHEACNSFYKGVMNPMMWDWDTSDNVCSRASKALGYYVETLHKSDILPRDIDFSKHKFCNLLDTAVSLPKITMKDFPCMREVGVCQCRSNRYFSRNLGGEIEKEARKIIQQRRVFNCLDCLKSQGVSGKEESCRVPHF